MSENKDIKFDVAAAVKSVEITGDVARVKLGDEKSFTSNTDIPAATLKQVHDYKHAYTTAAVDHSCQAAEQILDANKDVKKVIVETPYTVSKRGGITVNVDRVKTFPNPQDKANPYVRTGVSVVAEDPSSAAASSVVNTWKQNLTAKYVK